jgi:hypothetical protein
VSQSSEFCHHNHFCCFSMTVYCRKSIFRYRLSPETYGYTLVFITSSSFLGSTAQLRSWPPRLNFLEASQHFLFYRVGLLAPRPTPIPDDHASVFISLRGRVATHFSRLLRHAWVTVGLFLFLGHQSGTYLSLPSVN